MMAASTSVLSSVGARFSYSPSFEALKKQKMIPAAATARSQSFVVKAEGGINPEIRKSEAKVVDNVVVSELSKPLTAYCR